jgi:hypothetical protein
VLQNFFSIVSLWVREMVFNATVNNISIILWRSVLLVEEIGVRDRTVIGCTTNCVISSYHHQVLSSNSAHGEVYSIKYYVIKLVSDLQHVGCFIQVFRFPPPIKLTTTIQLKYFWKWHYNSSPQSNKLNLAAMILGKNRFIFLKVDLSWCGVSGASHWQALSHYVVSSTSRHEWDSNSQC